MFGAHKKVLDRLLDKLQSRKEQFELSPLSVLNVLCEGYSSETEEWRADLDATVVLLETKTNLISRSVLQPTKDTSEYESLSRDLHSCNTDLVFLNNILDFEVKFGDFCNSMLGVLDDLRSATRTNKTTSRKMRADVRQHLAYVQNSSRLKQTQAQTLSKRVDSKMSLVGYHRSGYV